MFFFFVMQRPLGVTHSWWTFSIILARSGQSHVRNNSRYTVLARNETMHNTWSTSSFFRVFQFLIVVAVVVVVIVIALYRTVTSKRSEREAARGAKHAIYVVRGVFSRAETYRISSTSNHVSILAQRDTAYRILDERRDAYCHGSDR